MKENLKAYLLSVVSVGAIVGLIYISYLLLVPMRILDRAVDRKVTEQSQQYVETQRSALVNLNTQYERTDDDTYRNAIKLQMCEIANTIPNDDIPTLIKVKLTSCL